MHSVALRGAMALLLTFALGLLAVPALAEGPAVESPNGKFSLDGGRVDGESLQLLDGSFAFPITESFGAQLDGAGGLLSEDDLVYALGGQLFWRDPELGLVGLEAAYADRPEEDMAVRRFGMSSELYRERFTASGRVGYSRGDVGNGAYAGIDFTYYATDNLALRVGGTLAPGERGDAVTLGAEMQPGLGGLSLFTSAAFGEEDFESAQLGVRYYFDSDERSLKMRQRQQDPIGIGSLIRGLETREEPRCKSAPLHDYGDFISRIPVDSCAAPPKGIDAINLD